MSEFYEKAIKDLFLTIQRTIMFLTASLGSMALLFHQSPNNGELIITVSFFISSVISYALFNYGKKEFAYHFFLIATCSIYLSGFAYFELKSYGLMILFQSAIIYSFIFLRKLSWKIGYFSLIMLCQFIAIFYIYKYQNNLSSALISDLIYCLAQSLGTFILCWFLVNNIEKFRKGLDQTRERLNGAKEKFEEQNFELKKRTEKLKSYEKQNKKKSEFEILVSEKLTPLSNNIENFLGMLAPRIKSNLDEKETEIFDFAMKNAAELTKSITGLHDLSFIAKRPPLFESFSPARLFQEIKMEFFEDIAKHNVYLGFKGADEEIVADKTLIKKFFQLTIGNAIQFKSPYREPEIMVFLEGDESSWVFKIKDNGIGIQKELRNSVFNIFTQLEQGNSKKGSGIGLTICRQIAQLHNGAIWIENGIAGGTAIVLQIPKKELKKAEVSASKEEPVFTKQLD